MARRICIFLLSNVLTAALTGLLFAVGVVHADDIIEHDSESVIEPELERRTITEADIDSEDFEAGVYAGVMSIEDFGTCRLPHHRGFLCRGRLRAYRGQ
jgi:hypothetical protein